MNKYELVLVLNGNLEDENKAAAMEKALSYITRNGGNVVNVDDWGKKKLAYEIQKMNEAFYEVVTFEAPLNAIAEIESSIRIMEQVIRFLIVKQEA